MKKNFALMCLFYLLLDISPLFLRSIMLLLSWIRLTCFVSIPLPFMKYKLHIIMEMASPTPTSSLLHELFVFSFCLFELLMMAPPPLSCRPLLAPCSPNKRCVKHPWVILVCWCHLSWFEASEFEYSSAIEAPAWACPSCLNLVFWLVMTGMMLPLEYHVLLAFAKTPIGPQCGGT